MEKKDSRNGFAWLSLVAASYHRTGNVEKANELLSELEIQSKTDTKPLYSLAMNYAELGRRDEAITALQKCFDLREERMVWIRAEPRFANLYNDEKFQQIVRQMGLK